MRGRGGRRLLIWDAPNMHMCLSEVIGAKASAATRPDMAAVLAWWCGRATSMDDTIEAAVFANVPAGLEAPMATWLATLRHAGFAVFVRPKLRQRDDVDTDMIRHIERRFAQGNLVDLAVASHDAKAFRGPLRRYGQAGVPVTVMGFRERDAFAAASPELAFVDLEDVPGAFAHPLPRTNLYDLPSSGRWFEPFVAPQPRPRTADDAGDGATFDADEARGDAGAAPVDAPARTTVLDRIVGAVEEAKAAGRAGLGSRQVVDLVTETWPEHGLDELGFASERDLVEALRDEAGLTLHPGPDNRLVLSLAPQPPPTAPDNDPPIDLRQPHPPATPDPGTDQPAAPPGGATTPPEASARSDEATAPAETATPPEAAVAAQTARPAEATTATQATTPAETAAQAQKASLTIEAAAPEAATQGAATRGAATPDTATPDAATPDAATPEAATPDTATPEAATRGAAAPEAATPDAATPEVATSPEVAPRAEIEPAAKPSAARDHPFYQPFAPRRP
jgi:uncharacterized protein